MKCGDRQIITKNEHKFGNRTSKDCGRSFDVSSSDKSILSRKDSSYSFHRPVISEGVVVFDDDDISWFTCLPFGDAGDIHSTIFSRNDVSLPGRDSSDDGVGCLSESQFLDMLGVPGQSGSGLESIW